jgi:hypothetical protein
MRSISSDTKGVVDLGVVLMIGIAFACLMVIAFIIFKVRDQLLPTAPGVTTSVDYNNSWNSIRNVTNGFDNAVNLILVAITIFILAIAISALLMLRGR